MTRRAAVLAALACALGAGPAHAACEARVDISQDDPYAPFVVGDSVTVAAGRALAQHGFSVDAKSCRTYAQGLEILAGRELPDHTVIALGSNASVSAAQIRTTLEMAGAFGRVTFVLPRALGGGPDADGQVMRAAEEAYPDQVSVLDWPAHSDAHPEWLASDGLHLTGAGAQAFADFIADGASVEPVDPVEPPPPPEPEPRRKLKPPPGSPHLEAMWSAVGRALVAAAEPAVRFLSQLVPSGGAQAQDL